MGKPLKNVPFDRVIEAMTGHRVLAFDAHDPAHRAIVEVLKTAGGNSVKAINASGGIQSARPNEVGNKVEPFLKDALNSIADVKADTPKTPSGRRKSSGYPDIEVEMGGRIAYVECKTYHRENAETTQRSFYFSPSDEFKVTCDALHLLMAYEMVRAQDGRYRANGFKLLTLEHLSLDVKHEFNSDNRRLYSGRDGTRLIHSETDAIR